MNSLFNHIISDWKRYGVTDRQWKLLQIKSYRPTILFSKGPSFSPTFDQAPYKDYFKVAVSQAGLEVPDVDLIIGQDKNNRDAILDAGYKGLIITAMKPEWQESWTTRFKTSYEFALRVLGELGCRTLTVIGHDGKGVPSFDYPNHPEYDNNFVSDYLAKNPVFKQREDETIAKYKLNINNIGKL